MREPKGRISVVMPTGKRMDAINNLSEAIKANAEATVALAQVIERLQAPQVTISGCHIQTDGATGIHVGSDDDSIEQGVYHYSPTGYSEYDYGYPSSKKLKPDEEIPKCYGEDEEPEDDGTEDEEYDE